MEIITADSLYWFYSTAAQVYAVVIGFVAMAAIYKLQLIANSIHNIMRESIGCRMHHFGPHANLQEHELFIRSFDSIILRERTLDDIKENANAHTFELIGHYEAVHHNLFRKEMIISFARSNILITALSIFLCCFNLLFIDWTFYSIENTKYGIFLLLINVLISLYVIIFFVRIIKFTMRLITD